MGTADELKKPGNEEQQSISHDLSLKKRLEIQKLEIQKLESLKLKEEKQKQLAALQESIKFKAEPLPADAPLIDFLEKKIPMLAGLLHSADGTGSSLLKLFEVQGHMARQSVAAGFQGAGLGLAAIDFLRIPAVYFAAWMLGQKPPITLTTNAKWLYSAVLLSLTIVALAVPAAAPPIAFVTSSLGLIMGTFTLAKHFYERHKVRKALRETEAQIKSEMAALTALQKEAADLASRLDALEKGQSDPSLHQQIENLQQRFDEKKQILQNLHNQQAKQQRELAVLGWAVVADKGIAVVLGALALTGLTLSLFFPPVGLGILAGTAAAGGLYLVARISYPLIKSLANKLIAKDNKEAETIQSEPEQQSEAGFAPERSLGEGKQINLRQANPSLAEAPVERANPRANLAEKRQDSTGLAVSELYGEQATTALKAIVADSECSEWIEQSNRKLQDSVHKHDVSAVIQVCKDFVREAEDRAERAASLKELPALDSAFALLKQVHAERGLSEQQQAEIIGCTPLATALQDSQLSFKQTDNGTRAEVSEIFSDHHPQAIDMNK